MLRRFQIAGRIAHYTDIQSKPEFAEWRHRASA
jgi:hypothetical protein